MFMNLEVLKRNFEKEFRSNKITIEDIERIIKVIKQSWYIEEDELCCGYDIQTNSSNKVSEIHLGFGSQSEKGKYHNIILKVDEEFSNHEEFYITDLYFDFQVEFASQITSRRRGK